MSPIPPYMGSHFGHAIASLGDLDGGGGSAQAIAIGAPYDDLGPQFEGAVIIHFLDSSGAVLSTQRISQGEGGFTGSLGFQSLFWQFVSHSR